MTVNCPICGRHMTPMDNRKNRIFVNGLDLPICNHCADKKQEIAEKIKNSTVKDIASLRTPENRVFIDTILDENPKLLRQNSSQQINGKTVEFAFVQGRKNPTTTGET